jgi:hypothetical protein
MTSDEAQQLLVTISDDIGFGAGRLLSQMLDTDPATICRLVTGKGRLHKLTVDTLNFLADAEDSNYESYAIEKETTRGEFVIRHRLVDGEIQVTWHYKQ